MNMPTKTFVPLGALVAGMVSSAALAQSPLPLPNPQVPQTPDNRSALPKEWPCLSKLNPVRMFRFEKGTTLDPQILQA